MWGCPHWRFELAKLEVFPKALNSSVSMASLCVNGGILLSRAKCHTLRQDAGYDGRECKGRDWFAV